MKTFFLSLSSGSSTSSELIEILKTALRVLAEGPGDPLPPLNWWNVLYSLKGTSNKTLHYSGSFVPARKSYGIGLDTKRLFWRKFCVYKRHCASPISKVVHIVSDSFLIGQSVVISQIVERCTSILADSTFPV